MFLLIKQLIFNQKQGIILIWKVINLLNFSSKNKISRIGKNTQTFEFMSALDKDDCRLIKQIVHQHLSFEK